MLLQEFAGTLAVDGAFHKGLRDDRPMGTSVDAKTLMPQPIFFPERARIRFHPCHTCVKIFPPSTCRQSGSVVDAPHFASNHPQSLWITLWASFRRKRQVTYRKGFFFFRSIFERPALPNAIREL
jgi:hypothetical protein